MIITYRPELENPPMAKECSVGFSFLPTKGARKVSYVRLNSGVTRNFDKQVWAKIKDYDKPGGRAATHFVSFGGGARGGGGGGDFEMKFKI